jgi:antitoxin PrlF
MREEVILEVHMAVQVTTKGQVTIPKRVRELLKIQPGSAVDFLIEPDGRVILRKVGRQAKVRSRFAALRGRATVRMRTEEIMALTRGED